MDEVPLERLTPELHSKLSKKVAQLTKVIYHLNTRNEDSDAKLQQVQADYEAEIASLLEESNQKITAAKDEGGGQQKKAIIAMEKQVAELEKTYAAEKAKALKELEAYTVKLKVRLPTVAPDPSAACR